MTTAYEAYQCGFTDRQANPDAKWDAMNPFAIPWLVNYWLDGWGDAAGEFRWYSADGKIAVPWDVDGGRCKECGNYPMRVRRDGQLVCLNPDSRYMCKTRYPPFDHAAADLRTAQLDAGAGI